MTGFYKFMVGHRMIVDEQEFYRSAQRFEVVLRSRRHCTAGVEDNTSVVFLVARSVCRVCREVK